MSLLKEFRDKAAKELSIKLNIADFMYFVLNGDTETENAVLNFSDITLSKLYVKKTQLSLSHLENLVSRKSWSFQSFEFCISDYKDYSSDLEQQLTKIGQNILEKRISKVPSDFSSVMRSLIFLHFFGCEKPDTLFFPSFPCSCSNYIPWREKEAKLNEKLKQSPVVFVTGSAGSGKRQLIINATKDKYPPCSSDVYWLDIEKTLSLQDGLSQIKFLKEKTANSDILPNLRSKDSSSLLVIRKAILENTDLKYIEETLYGMNLRIIISTYTNVSDKADISVNLDCRPMANLKKIFYKYYKYRQDSPFSEEEFQTLAKNVSYNVFVLTLIGKALSQRAAILTKDSLLNAFESLYYEPKLPNVHTFYHPEDEIERKSKSGQRLFTLIVKKLLLLYPEDKFSDELSKLSVWAKTPILKSSLEKHWEPQEIEAWINHGFLQYYDYDKEKLYMPNLIADIIWKNFPIDFKDYQKTIFSFFQSIACGQSFSIPYTDLYEIIFQMILRFHFQISITDSRIKSAQQKEIQDWNYFLTDVIEYYMRLGNFRYAQTLLPCLYLRRTKHGKILPAKEIESAIRKLLTLRANYMSSPDMVTAIERLQETLHQQQEHLKIESTYCEIVFSVFTGIIEDLCDCTAEIALQYASAILLKNYPEPNQIYACIKNLDTCSNLLRSLHPYSSSYYSDVKSYLTSLVSITYHFEHDDLVASMNQWDSVAKYFAFFEDDPPEGEADTYFKAKCMIFYSSLITLCFENLREENYRHPIDHFKNLSMIFQKHIWSYHTAWMFFACASLLSYIMHLNRTTFLSTDSKEICEILIDCMKRYKNFITAQISLPETQKISYNTAIKNMLRSLKDFLQQSSESAPE